MHSVVSLKYDVSLTNKKSMPNQNEATAIIFSIIRGSIPDHIKGILLTLNRVLVFKGRLNFFPFGYFHTGCVHSIL